MTKILIITQNFFPEIGSGANRMTKIYQLINEKASVTVLTTEPQYPNKTYYEQNKFFDHNAEQLNIFRIKTRVHRFEKKIMFRFLLYLEVFIKFYIKILKDSSQYDVIYVTSPPLSIPLVGILAKKKFKCKLIVEIRDLWPETIKAMEIVKSPFIWIIMKISYMLEKKIYNIADKIVVNSEGFFDYIKAIVKKDKEIIFLPNSLIKEELKIPLKKTDSKNFTVIYAGNIGFAQNIDNFVTLAIKYREHKNIKFVLMGYGSKFDEIKLEIEKLKLANIEINLPEPRPVALKMIQSADIAYVGLNKHDIFKTVIPGKIIDYMGMGTPILGTTYGYSRKIIEDAKAGLIYDESDFDGIEEGFKKLLDKKTNEVFGENGKNYAREYFNWDYNKSILFNLIFNN